MILALTLASALTGWVPARWFSSDPKSLELLDGVPVNCLLLQPGDWRAAFLAGARERKVAVLGVIHPAGDVAALAALAASLKLDGLVLEGENSRAAAGTARSSGLPVIELGPRRALVEPSAEGIAGTWQGVWPGINPQEDEGAALAGPTSTPWLDTNSGFLRFLRSMTGATLWIGNRPPPGKAFPVIRYQQAVADAALAGARWVVSLDEDFERRLAARDSKAVRDWREIGSLLEFLEEQRRWRALRPYGQVALVQEPAEGAMISGGVLDMLAVQHLPVRPLPPARVTPASLESVSLVLKLAEGQPEALLGVARAGGAMAQPEPGWKFPIASADQYAIRKADLPKLESLWQIVKQATGRQNFGVRLFNAGSMLSNPLTDGKKLVILLVNYTGYPVEAITVHLLGTWKKVRLLAPGRAPRELSPYPTRDGTGVEIDTVGVLAAVEVE